MPQTAAVYWESPVRIYDFKEKKGLVSATIVFPQERLAYWGEVLACISRDNRSFDLFIVQRRGMNTLQFCLILEAPPDSPGLLRLREAKENEQETSLTLDFPVEMVSFHGPHFHDRYGLAQAASAALESGNLPVLVMGCTGTTISLVVPQDGAQTAVQLLAGTFIVP